MDSLAADLRYAFRSILKRPGFTALAVLTLALGIGVNTVAFSAVSALLLRPFRIADADRLGWVMLPGPGNPRGYATTAEFQSLERHIRSMDAIEAEARIPVSLRTPNGAEQSWALAVSDHYLQTFQAPFALGRPFSRADLHGDALLAVVSHRFWKERLGAPGSLAGVTLVVSGRVFAVLGVVADDFQGPGGLYAPDMWLPLSRIDVLHVERRRTEDAWLTLFGRLAAGTTKAQAEAELTGFAKHQAPHAEGADRRRGAFHVMIDGHPDLQEIGPVAWLALGAVNVVLLIACFNLSSLLIARAAERQAEMGVRSALGATRWRILRQLLTESIVLASLAGAASLVVAAWSGDLLSTFSLPAPIPQRVHFGVDWMLVAFTIVVTLVAGLLPAVLSGLRATRVSVLGSMRGDGGVSRSRLRSLFVVAQIAGSTAFVVAAALFVRSFFETVAVDAGFDTEHIAVLQVSPGSHGYSPDESRRFLLTLEQRIAALPQVREVALADRVPFYVGMAHSVEYTAGARDCRASDCATAAVYVVGPRHFAAMGLPILAGRDFSTADVEAGSRVIVSQYLAEQVWPGQEPVGRTLRLGDDGQLVQIIGVAANIRHRNLSERPGAYIYQTLQPSSFAGGLVLIVRTLGDPRQLLAPLREQLRTMDPGVPPAALDTMIERMKLPLWPARTAAGFFVVCGALALALAAIGLFGVMYFTVAQRTREFGIRVAIGATRSRVLRHVLGEGLRLAIPGVLLGMTAGHVAGRVLARALYGITPADLVSLGGSAAIQLLVALAACALPAYRATTADPMTALRRE